MAKRTKTFTGTGTSGFVTHYKTMNGTPLARKPGGSFTVPKTKLETNIFDDFDHIRVIFKFDDNGKIREKIEVTMFGTKLKDMNFYNPSKRFSLIIDEDIFVSITKEQVFTEDSVLYSKI
tara:strand:- start:244 stop:603 length:360 start_codon:yes stop_codon:yes gene_type:complete